MIFPSKTNIDLSIVHEVMIKKIDFSKSFYYIKSRYNIKPVYDKNMQKGKGKLSKNYLKITFFELNYLQILRLIKKSIQTVL